MDIRLNEKTAIITGAASGIGYAIAEGLHESGARVVVADINAEAAEAAAKKLGKNALAMQIDISDVSACRGLVADVIDQFGQLDILVNNAGICPLRPLDPLR